MTLGPQNEPQFELVFEPSNPVIEPPADPSDDADTGDDDDDERQKD